MPLKLAPLLNTLTILDKRTAIPKQLDVTGSDEFARAQRFLVTEVERQYNKGLPVRIIVLKARQLGMSTVTAGIMYWWAFMHRGTNGLIVTHENEASIGLFEKTKLFWDDWRFKDLYTPKSLTQRRMSWEETRSSLRIATAGNRLSGRGSTFHSVHASEAAYYPDAATLFSGLASTVPQYHGSLVIVESTANGIGNWYHEQWKMAENGENGYAPLFFPFWMHEEYKIPTTLATTLELSADEKHILSLGASFESIEWRRWALRNIAGNDEQYLGQEYPAYPDEAFISSGKNVFPLKKLEECYEPERGHRGMLVSLDEHGSNPKYTPDPTGPLFVYRAPTKKDIRDDRYFIAGDPSMTVEGDPACIQVINRGTMEQVAVWHGRIGPIEFARQMMMLGRWYHNAELCPEVEGGGQATIATILNAGYPNVWLDRRSDKAPGKVTNSYGWSTNFQRKRDAIGTLQYLIGDNSIIIHDKKTYDQLRNYIVRENGELGCANEKEHDDAVMALAIGVKASLTEGPFSESLHRNNVVEMFATDDA